MTFVNLIGKVVSFDSKESESGTKYTDLRSVMRPYKIMKGITKQIILKYFYLNIIKKAQDHFKKGYGNCIKGLRS